MNMRQLLLAAIFSASAVPASAAITANAITANAITANALNANAITANAPSVAGVATPAAVGAGSVDDVIGVELPGGQIIAK